MDKSKVDYFISADWSKNPGKRSVYVADVRERRIEVKACKSWDVHALLRLAEGLKERGPVLIGVDVVLGVPEDYLQMWPNTPENFVDWLNNLDSSGEFFGTVDNPDEWRFDRPWFKVNRGEGGRTSFTNQLHSRMLRKIDAATQANPVFAVAGIPGTVGAGTREFWKELIPHLRCDRGFAVWPFEGDLASLLKRHGAVLCETYPALAYAAALDDALPTRRVVISKTQRMCRVSVCDRLTKMHASRIDLGGLDALRENEDDFDAHITATAFLRCIYEGHEIVSSEWIDPRAEGSMLFAGVVDPYRRSGKNGLTGKATNTSSELGSASNRAPYRCPIPGCKKEFMGSRRGWDAHVGSVKTHPDWLPEVNDPETRKRLFRKEFSSWFE